MNRPRRRTLLLAILLGTLLAAWWWPSAVDPAQVDAGGLAAPATVVQSETATSPLSASANVNGAGNVAKIRPEPARRESAPTPLDEPALGFRAPPERRADDLARLNSASDLAPLLAEFQRRAALGDADAAARMRDIYRNSQSTKSGWSERRSWGEAQSTSPPVVSRKVPRGL